MATEFGFCNVDNNACVLLWLLFTILAILNRRRGDLHLNKGEKVGLMEDGG